MAAGPPAPTRDAAALVSGAEAVASSALAVLASAIIVSYIVDRVGFAIVPSAILPAALAAGAATFVWLSRRARWQTNETVALTGVAIAVFGWLLWIARPALLPLGRGPDLTHHLQLIDYIDRHWRLVHDTRVEAYLGEMIHYTPGSHLLASLAGAWTQTDGLHAVHTIVSLSVALKAGLVFLITLRLLPQGAPRIPLAVASALLLGLPRAYFIGSFTHDSFFSQVVSEMFAVAMWWAVAAWDERPWTGWVALFALAGIAGFLTWPVFIGPPVLVLVTLALVRKGLAATDRLAHLALGIGPIVMVAAVYAAGRAGWILIVRTSGAALRPSPSVVGWTFLLLSAAGLAFALLRRHARATTLLVAFIAAQAAVLFALAKAHGADTPYMALKMFYLALYPLAAAASLALAAAWQAAVRLSNGRFVSRTADIWSDRLTWVLVALLGIIVARQLAAAPRPKPAVSEAVNLAGRWARANVDPACVDYLVADADTAYWLHLAVLGNPRLSARTADDDTFVPYKAMVRWIVPRGLPFAIAEDLAALPKDIRSNVDVLAEFGRAAVVRRRGEASCG